MSSAGATNKTGHQANAAASIQVHGGDVSGVDQLVVHKHPGACGAVGGLGDFGLGHHSGAVAGAVSDFDLKGGGVSTTNKTGHQANAAASVQVHGGDVSGVDQLVVHKHPGACGAVGGLGDFGLGHHSGAVAGAVSDFDLKGGGVSTTNKTGHQANAAASVQVHGGDVSGVDQLVVHKHPGACGAVGGLGDFGLGHHSGAVAGAVSDFDLKGGGVSATNKTGHQANAAASVQVHGGDVSGVDQLVVHKHPGALGLGGLLGKFVL